MLTLWGNNKHLTGDGLSRRDILRVGTLGVAGLTLADLLRLRAHGQEKRSAGKAVIMIYLAGGPSHIDLYDMKPDAPVEIRGEFRPIRTNVPGIDICEHMPRQATLADKFAIVRGVRIGDRHSPSAVMKGYFTPRADKPAFGCLVSRLRGRTPGPMPPYVSLISGGSDENPGDLGPAYRPFGSGGGAGLENLRPARGVTAGQLADRRVLLRAFDTVSRTVDARGELAGLDAFQRQALEMITSSRARDAFDISKESAAVRARYGSFTAFLQARRMVEAGVSVVTVQHTPPKPKDPNSVSPNWDTHDDNFNILRSHLPVYDAGVATLIEDLSQRGLDRDVCVVLWASSAARRVSGRSCSRAGA
jgi:Protein of unknown function (DUF1501)